MIGKFLIITFAVAVYALTVTARPGPDDGPGLGPLKPPSGMSPPGNATGPNCDQMLEQCAKNEGSGKPMQSMPYGNYGVVLLNCDNVKKTCTANTEIPSAPPAPTMMSGLPTNAPSSY